MKQILLIRNLEVEQANAVTGLTWGFPGITHFLGFTHALSRQLEPVFGFGLGGVGVICHHHQVPAQAGPWGDQQFAISRNPHFTAKQLAKLNSKGAPPPFTEEGRMHLCLTLLIEMERSLPATGPIRDDFINQVQTGLGRMRLAGGLLTRWGAIECVNPPGPSEEDGQGRKAFLGSLLPGFALIARTDLWQQRNDLAPFEADDPLGRILALNRLVYRHHQPGPDPDDPHAQSGGWHLEERQHHGWVVPYMVGFRALSPLYEPGSVAGARDGTVPFRFVEPVYQLAAWCHPSRLEIEDLFWRAWADADQGYYLGINGQDGMPDQPWRDEPDSLNEFDL